MDPLPNAFVKYASFASDNETLAALLDINLGRTDGFSRCLKIDSVVLATI